MSSTARALSPSSRETKWTVIAGAMVGSVRLMNTDAFVMGRSPDCDFVIISDPKCSRKHARIEWTSEGCVLTNLTEENPVLVNNLAVNRANLNDGDVVTLGGTQIQFHQTSVANESSISHRQLSVVTTSQPNHAQIQNRPAPSTATYSRPTVRPQSSRPVKAPGNRLVFYAIIAIIGLFFFLDNSAKKKAVVKLRTEQQINSDIESANKMQEAALAQPNRMNNQSITARQAQENYVRGFRDYSKGQFDRSLDAFQACLALNPSHVLCNRYIRLARRRFNELVQYNMVLGQKYRDQNQFNACRSAFRNVMVMVKDSSTATYREAKANYDACNAESEGHY